MQQVFDRSVPDNILPELEGKVREFRQRVGAHGVQVVCAATASACCSLRGRPNGVIPLSSGTARNWRQAQLRGRRALSGTARLGSLASLDRYDLLVIDASGRDVPGDLFGFAHSRLIPSIKLVRLEGKDFPSTVKLPVVSAKLRDTATDPLIYWRKPEELAFAVDRELAELERLVAEDLQRAKTAEDAARYFGSLGRARLRVFLSNAGEDGELALAVAESNQSPLHRPVPLQGST